MNKGKIARLAGFVGALGISAALVAMASSTTGAYFTDSSNGNLKASSGSLQISTTATNLNFSGLNPGIDETKSFTYTVSANSTTSADIWMVFNPNTDAYGRFTGANHYEYGSANYDGGGLGMYGHFKVVGIQGHYFESYNLQLAATHEDGAPGMDNGACQVNADGNGGGTAQGHVAGVNDISECGVPAMIKLASNVAAGDTGNATVTFGLTGRQTQQNQQNDPNVPFQVGATQPGQRPGATW